MASSSETQCPIKVVEEELLEVSNTKVNPNWKASSIQEEFEMSYFSRTLFYLIIIDAMNEINFLWQWPQ